MILHYFRSEKLSRFANLVKDRIEFAGRRSLIYYTIKKYTFLNYRYIYLYIYGILYGMQSWLAAWGNIPSTGKRSADLTARIAEEATDTDFETT